MAKVIGSLPMPHLPADGCQRQNNPSRIKNSAGDAGIGKLFEIVVVRQPGHFGVGDLSLGIRPLKSARPRSQQRMAKGGLRRRPPVIKPRADAGGAGGKITVESNRKNPQPNQQNRDQRRPFQSRRPRQTKQTSAADRHGNQPAQF